MNWKIDTGGGEPIYLQIVEQIRRAVALGRLRPEDALPSVRQLAQDLTINPNTVARAYLELEHQGFIYKRQGQGTFVSAEAAAAARRERSRAVVALLEKAIGEAVQSGMAAAEIRALCDQLIERYEVETV